MPSISYHGGMVRWWYTQNKPGSDFGYDVKIPQLPSQKSLILIGRWNLNLLYEIKKVVKADKLIIRPWYNKLKNYFVHHKFRKA